MWYFHRTSNELRIQVYSIFGLRGTHLYLPSPHNQIYPEFVSCSNHSRQKKNFFFWDKQKFNTKRSKVVSFENKKKTIFLLLTFYLNRLICSISSLLRFMTFSPRTKSLLKVKADEFFAQYNFSSFLFILRIHIQHVISFSSFPMPATSNRLNWINENPHTENSCTFLWAEERRFHTFIFPQQNTWQIGNSPGPIHWTRMRKFEANPLLLASSVDTPIHNSRFHLIALHLCIQCELALSYMWRSVTGQAILAFEVTMSQSGASRHAYCVDEAPTKPSEGQKIFWLSCVKKLLALTQPQKDITKNRQLPKI